MILHCDMDAFYASVEERERPELVGKPVIVGGSPEKRGVVSAANYVARSYGVHSAMPAATAHRLCPHGIFLPPRISYYAEVSRQIREIFERFTPLVEPLSLDEAFLDVTGSEQLFGPAAEIGRKIKQVVREETGLVVSVGVAPNKFLAKIASDFKKPDGFMVVEPEHVQEFLDPLPVERLWGVGKAGEQSIPATRHSHHRSASPMADGHLEEPFWFARRTSLAVGPRNRRRPGSARTGGEVDLPRDDLRAGHRRSGGASGLACGFDGAGGMAASTAWPSRSGRPPQGSFRRLLD